MKSVTRLDDKLNAVLISTAAACLLGLNVSTWHGAALGRDGLVAQSLPPARSAADAQAQVAAAHGAAVTGVVHVAAR